ncbi:MAG: ParA family protein [Hyphomicrobiales bacterium]|nr:ParA family protein [Hyphomicrobiales bacterium]
MITILVANMKGGAGKTTIATNLAAAYADNGLKTTLADADRQRSSLRWSRTRPDTASPVTGVDWTKQFDDVPKGTARLVVDSPAGMRSKRVDDLVRLADVILVPIVPSVFDESATSKFLRQLQDVKPVRKGKRPYALVRNRVRRRSRATEHLEKFIDSLDCDAVGCVFDRAILPEVAADGCGVFDVGGKRGQSLREDWFEILDFIEARV